MTLPSKFKGRLHYQDQIEAGSDLPLVTSCLGIQQMELRNLLQTRKMKTLVQSQSTISPRGRELFLTQTQTNLGPEILRRF